MKCTNIRILQYRAAVSDSPRCEPQKAQGHLKNDFFKLKHKTELMCSHRHKVGQNALRSKQQNK